MPVGGGALVPVGCGHDGEAAWASWKVGALDWKCRLTKDGLDSTLAGGDEVAMRLPAFAFDGERETEIASDGKTLSIRHRGWKCAYSTDGKIVDTGHVSCNRNGRYRVFEARGDRHLSVRVTIERTDKK